MKKLVIAGGTGFLGSVIIKHFSTRFDEIVLLSRKRTSELHDQRESAAVKRRLNNGNVRTAIWDARTFCGWEKELDGADALINMTGRSVDCRYNQMNKDLILNSRVDSTKILGEAIAQCAHPPEVWFNSSTATIYRHSLDKEMTEASGEIGSGFSVNVATAWENAFFKSETPLTRKVALRTSIVLGKDGGALQPIKHITKLGLGGRQGNGKQKFSWIHEEDFVRSIAFILDSKLEGPINIVAPKPTTNKALMKMMRDTLNIPFGIPAPKPILEIGAFMIRTETELLLKSRNVIPQRLLEAGFTFNHPDIEKTLQDLLV